MAYDLVIRGATVVDGTGAKPHTADVGVESGRIAEVGRVDGRTGRTIDGDGLILAPGWVDVHTHYDGQATWDPDLSPSSWHGCTTVVMGNCGVGFAPVRPGDHSFLIELMESVEDIPGTALHEGIDWRWESFEEYLDALDAMPRAIDIAAQVPHAALRAYVMGERCHEDATPLEVDEMATLVRRALRAGAVGFTTSRTVLHRSRHGLIPGTAAPQEELLRIADAMGEVGGRVFGLVSDRAIIEPERSVLIDVAKRINGMLTYSLTEMPRDPLAWRRALDDATQLQAQGVPIVPQVADRCVGALFGLQSSVHPFITHPTYRRLADRPLAERVAELRKPEVRAALLAEDVETDNKIRRGMMQHWGLMFPLGDPPDYEPAASSSAHAVAESQRRTPQEVVLDWLLEREGTALLYVPIAGYAQHSLDAIRTMMTHDTTILGLSDGGAHCGLICDVSMPTFLLTHWVRDRTAGERLPLEAAVELQTRRTAHAYGFTDRGTIEPGMRADLNLIDLDGMVLHAPEMAYDLPAGGRRLVQRVDGYVATICAGEVIAENGSLTGSRPGRLVRASSTRA